jgi:hypothetical protein
MTIERSRRGAVTGLFVLTIALAGCERLLDIERAETVIKSGLNEQLKMAFSSVDCPESRAMKAGDEFDCKATAESGGVLTVKVTQNDDAGTIKWTLVDGERVLAIENLEQQIKDSIAKQIKVNATLDCGATRRRIAVAGQTIECSASDGTESRKVIVTIKDDRGNVDWTLK